MPRLTLVPLSRRPVATGMALLGALSLSTLGVTHRSQAADADEPPAPITGIDSPQNPYLAPNDRNSMHNDAWATDAYAGPGPQGDRPKSTYRFYGIKECATLTFESHGRMLGLCGDLKGPSLNILDPQSMKALDTTTLPPRRESDGPLLQNLCGGAYMYLNERDQAVVATTDRRILTFSAADDKGGPALKQVNLWDLQQAVPESDCLIALTPDWQGRVWFETKAGRVGTVNQHTGKVSVMELGEPIANSFAVDESGVYVVSEQALYKLAGGKDDEPTTVWRTPYDRGTRQKPGQLSQGSGTTPTILPGGVVAITDNAEPKMHVKMLNTSDGAPICEASAFGDGESATENSLVAVGPASVVVSNNYGYTRPASTLLGSTPVGGFARVDRKGDSCTVGWTSPEVSPSAVAKASLATGLVYSYTKRPDAALAEWYLTALDARTGRKVFSVLAGTGVGANNHYSAVTLGPDGAAYVPTLTGMMKVTDSD